MPNALFAIREALPFISHVSPSRLCVLAPHPHPQPATLRVAMRAGTLREICFGFQSP
jgi:hypothetical protein